MWWMWWMEILKLANKKTNERTEQLSRVSQSVVNTPFKTLLARFATRSDDEFRMTAYRGTWGTAVQ
jgi:hypothetical protein